MTEFLNKMTLGTISHDDPVFERADCEFLILALLKRNAISDMQAYALFGFLQILYQLTSKQSTHVADFKIQNATYIPIHDDPEKLAQYFKVLSEKLNLVGYAVSEPMLAAAFAELQGAERWVFFLDFSKSRRFLRLFNAVIEKTPIVVHQQGSQSIYYPTLSFYLKVLALIMPGHRPLEPQPVFGSVSDNTFTDMVIAGYRLITLHSQYVSSSPKEIHQAHDGPIMFMLHDIYHLFSSYQLLHKDAYQAVFQHILPKVKSIMDKDTFQLIKARLGDLNVANSHRLSLEVGATECRKPYDLFMFFLSDALMHSHKKSPFFLFIKLYKNFYRTGIKPSVFENKTITQALKKLVADFNLFPEETGFEKENISVFLNRLRGVLKLNGSDLVFGFTRNLMDIYDNFLETFSDDEKLTAVISKLFMMGDAHDVDSLDWILAAVLNEQTLSASAFVSRYKDAYERASNQFRLYGSIHAIEKNPFGPYRDCLIPHPSKAGLVKAAP